MGTSSQGNICSANSSLSAISCELKPQSTRPLTTMTAEWWQDMTWADMKAYETWTFMKRSFDHVKIGPDFAATRNTRDICNEWNEIGAMKDRISGTHRTRFSSHQSFSSWMSRSCMLSCLPSSCPVIILLSTCSKVAWTEFLVHAAFKHGFWIAEKSKKIPIDSVPNSISILVRGRPNSSRFPAAATSFALGRTESVRFNMAWASSLNNRA